MSTREENLSSRNQRSSLERDPEPIATTLCQEIEGESRAENPGIANATVPDSSDSSPISHFHVTVNSIMSFYDLVQKICLASLVMLGLFLFPSFISPHFFIIKYIYFVLIQFLIYCIYNIIDSIILIEICLYIESTFFIRYMSL